MSVLIYTFLYKIITPVEKVGGPLELICLLFANLANRNSSHIFRESQNHKMTAYVG